MSTNPSEPTGQQQHPLNWELKSDWLGKKSQVYKWISDHESQLIASCWDEEIAALLLSAPQLRAEVIKLRSENEQLKIQLDDLQKQG